MNNLFFEDLDDLEMIKGYLESNIPIYLHGLSGIGKSRRAKDIDNDLTIIYLSNATPELINGKTVLIPPITIKRITENGEIVEEVIKESFLKDEKPTWLTTLEEKCIKEPNKKHILFFDELSNAMPTIQNYVYNIILNREVNGKWYLPSNVRIIAAGNEVDESIVANEIPKPLFSRFAHIYIKTDIKKWIKWAIKANIHPAIIAYHAMTNGKYLRSEYTGTSPNSDPRRWEMLSNLLYHEKSIGSIDTLIDKKTAIDFINFIYGQIIPLKAIIENKIFNETKKYLSKMSIEEKYLMISELSQVDKINYNEIYDIVKYMNNDKLEDLFLLMNGEKDEGKMKHGI